jgi:hypothetical protein
MIATRGGTRCMGGDGWGDECPPKSFEILLKICKFINLSLQNKFFVSYKKFSLYFDPSFILKDKRISLYFDPFFIGVFLFQ